MGRWINNVMLTMLLAMSLMAQPALAQSQGNAQAKQRAMQIAEQRTNGKSLGARFINRDGKSGYRVRVFKDGKVRHVFIAMAALR